MNVLFNPIYLQLYMNAWVPACHLTVGQDCLILDIGDDLAVFEVRG